MLYHFYKKKHKFHRINLFIQNLFIYSERQNLLKIKQILFQENV
jgi:hypothetical protein